MCKCEICRESAKRWQRNNKERYNFIRNEWLKTGKGKKTSDRYRGKVYVKRQEASEEFKEFENLGC